MFIFPGAVFRLYTTGGPGVWCLSRLLPHSLFVVSAHVIFYGEHQLFPNIRIVADIEFTLTYARVFIDKGVKRVDDLARTTRLSIIPIRTTLYFVILTYSVLEPWFGDLDPGASGGSELNILLFRQISHDFIHPSRSESFNCGEGLNC